MPVPPAPNYQPQYRHLADKKEWQPIAYNIVCVLWILASAYNCFLAIQMDLPGFTPYMLVTSGLTIAVVIGLLMRSEWIAMIGRALCILTILGQIFPFWISLGRQRWGEFALSVLVLALAGFMIYLINYENE